MRTINWRTSNWWSIASYLRLKFIYLKVGLNWNCNLYTILCIYQFQEEAILRNENFERYQHLGRHGVVWWKEPIMHDICSSSPFQCRVSTSFSNFHQQGDESWDWSFSAMWEYLLSASQHHDWFFPVLLEMWQKLRTQVLYNVLPEVLGRLLCIYLYPPSEADKVSR
jgi:hypothetical protein